MTFLLAVLLGAALALLARRELSVYHAHQRDQDAMREDREVAVLESIFDREWER